MPDELNIETAFAIVKKHWTDNGVPLMQQIADHLDGKTVLTDEQLLSVVQELKIVNNMRWDWKVANNGINRSCVEGTVLSVKDPSSIIYSASKKCWAACAALVADLLGYDNRPSISRCYRDCIGCEKYSRTACMNIIKEQIQTVFGENGDFDKIESEISDGTWRLEE